MRDVSSLSFFTAARKRGVSALRLLVIGLTLALAACGSRVELFSAANESEANEVLSVLLDAGISAQKAVTKTGVAVSVDGQQV
ncbi:MAG: EscJ/YscJ/HrcJ family type III secretion inner membrane ring protein, partial [Achromobacter veterisilvae]